MINLIRVHLCLSVVIFLLSCASVPTAIPTKLDLSQERQLVKDLQNLEPEQKTVILNAFDKADSVNETVRIYARQLEEQNAKLKSDLASEKEDAESYRRWRFRVLAFLGILALWHTRKFWLPLVRKLMGFPV